MSLTVSQRPSTTVGSETSKWNAVGNPILYKMQRKDFTFNQVNNSGGNIQLQFNAVNVAASFAVGDTIYIKSDNDEYDLFATVTASAFSTNTLVTVNSAYTSTAPGGFTNNDDLRPGYRVETELYRSSDNTLISETILENSPNRYGQVTINVSTILRNYLSPDNDANLTGTTKVFNNTNAYVGFYIKYREVWLESAESQTNDSSNQFFAVLGARQIPAAYGGNMGEYAVIPDADEILNDTSFNTNWTNQGGLNDAWDLEATKMSVGLDVAGSQRVRRSLTFEAGHSYSINVVGELTGGGAQMDLSAFIGGSQQVVIFTDRDDAGAFDITIDFVADFDSSFFEFYAECFDADTVEIHDVIISEVGTVKFLTRLERPVMWAGYPFLVGIIVNEDVSSNVYLTAGEDSTTPSDHSGKLIEFDLNQIVTDQTVDSFDITLFEDGSIDDPQVSEVLEVEVRTACDNPVMLLGRNSLGGPLQWLFDVSQEYTFDYGNGKKNKRLVLTAQNLTINQWEALQDFITLGEVYRNNIVELTSSTIKTHTRVGQQVYTIDEDGNKIGVIVIPTRNATKTRQLKHQFEIEIEFPETFTP